MRIAVGGFMHETNTFAGRSTGWKDFVEPSAWPGLTVGEPMQETFRGLNLAISGFMEVAGAAGHEMVPLAWAAAQPGGRVTDDAFEVMSALLVGGIAAARPDAVFLELHGAMCSNRFDDAEGELLTRVRSVVGDDVPILAALDLHANVTRTMVGTANLMSAYRTYPHVDWGETGRRVARWFDRFRGWAGGGAQAFRQVPFLIPVVAGCTLLEPMRSLYARIERIEAETGVHLSLCPGFPAADFPDCGATVFGYGPDRATTQAAVDRFAAEVEAAEAAFAAHVPVPGPEAVARAIRIAATATRPVVIADAQDNAGAGATSSTTGLLRELIAQGAQDAWLALVHEPGIAAAAHRIGVGAEGNFLFGTGMVGPGQDALAVRARVEALSDGTFVATGPMIGGTTVHQGPTAVLAIDGIRVIVVSVRQQPLTQAIFTSLGIDPAGAKIIALKSSVHFRNHFQEIAEEVIVAATPGLMELDPREIRWTNLRRDVRRRPRA